MAGAAGTIDYQTTPHAGQVPTRFETEMSAERGRWLRRRFLWYVGFNLVLTVPSVLVFSFDIENAALLGSFMVLTLVLQVAAFVFAWRSPPRMELILWVSVWLYILTAVLGLVSSRVSFTDSFQSGTIGQELAGGGSNGGGGVSDAPPVDPVESPAPTEPAPPLTAEQLEALAQTRTQVAEARASLAAARERLEAMQDKPADLESRFAETVGSIGALDADAAEVETDLGALAIWTPPDEAAGDTDTSDLSTAGGTIRVNGNGNGLRLPGWSNAALWAGLTGLGTFFFAHLIACLFIPWTFRESLVPGAVALLAYVTIMLFDVVFSSLPWFLVPIFAIMAAGWMMPGSLWCMWRHARFPAQFRVRYESGRYRKLSEELTGARKLHEAVLPDQRHAGAVRLSYVYEPMQQIGGDLLYVRGDDPQGPMTAILLDVTGHGIAAALTVNRLLGEVDRTFAENTDATPGDLLARLNDYVHLTLSSHGVFVTGLAVQVTPDHANDGGCYDVCYANAGHPPAFLRRAVGGGCTSIDSTAFMLGVLPAGDFDPGEARLELNRGDVLLLYTDGAAEARSPDGRMITTRGLRDMFAKASPEDEPQRWPGDLLRAVTRHRAAPPDDDTLIATVYCPA